jgi:hypothetical protein
MKDVYTVFAEKCAALNAAGKRKQFDERAKNLTSVEAKINCADFVLGTVVKESKPPVTKHNGRTHNGGELFTESAGNFTETSEAEQLSAKSDAILAEAMGISKEDQRRLKGLPPATDKPLTPGQLREYRFARSIRINEADALRLALKVV